VEMADQKDRSRTLAEQPCQTPIAGRASKNDSRVRIAANTKKREETRESFVTAEGRDAY